jgi:hypothetical protein
VKRYFLLLPHVDINSSSSHLAFIFAHLHFFDSFNFNFPFIFFLSFYNAFIYLYIILSSFLTFLTFFPFFSSPFYIFPPKVKKIQLHQKCGPCRRQKFLKSQENQWVIPAKYQTVTWILFN